MLLNVNRISVLSLQTEREIVAYATFNFTKLLNRSTCARCCCLVNDKESAGSQLESAAGLA